jgi:xanthine dehydrogenase/oxidase
MPRAQNAHAYVNAGFLFKIKVTDGGKALEKPTLVYGGINPKFVSVCDDDDDDMIRQ